LSNRFEVQAALRDAGREIVAIVPSPSSHYLAASDNLGRVLVIDAVASCLVVRIFKGYRDAQCAWITLATAIDGDSQRMLLAIRAAKRNFVDVWQPFSMTAPLARITIPQECLIMQSLLEDDAAASRQSATCMVFNTIDLKLTPLSLPPHLQPFQ
jgi:hypothetical protein